MTDINRRAFVRAGSIAAVAATIVPRHVLGGPGHVAPSDRVNVALVGAGGRGAGNARDLMKLSDVQITTVADPAEHWDMSNFYYRSDAGRLPMCSEIEKHYGEKSPGYKVNQVIDYRELLADKSADVDAILCATPDHLHAHVSLTAMRAGKHVYCEKPLTHNIAEARLVAQVAKETGLATQMGNQGHSKDTIRETVELVQSGAVGPITEVHAWVPATRWNKGLVHPPTETETMPKGLDWDLWCGTREKVGFHSAYAPVSWRDFWQFGLGAMGDFGCHDLDSATWALNLSAPAVVQMMPAGQTDPKMIPYGEVGYFDFPSNEDHGPVRIHWYSGGLEPPRPDQLPPGQSLPRRGVLFVGDKGVIVCGGAGGQATVFPESLAESIVKPEPTIRRSAGHHRDWIDAIKGGPPASSEFGYGARLTEITLLGVMALRTGNPIHWDADALKADGVPEADAIIHGDYRDGWKIDS